MNPLSLSLIHIYRPVAADVLGTDPGSQYHGLTHSVLLQTDGHCHLFQMHADQRAANVQEMCIRDSL